MHITNQLPQPTEDSLYVDIHTDDIGEIAPASPDLSFALPLLSALHDRDQGKVLEFRAPLGSGLPTGWVRVQPYYMNWQDQRQLGFWKLVQEGYEEHPVFIASDCNYARNASDVESWGRRILH